MNRLYASLPLKSDIHEIRVFRLHPGKWAAKVTGDLEVVALSERPNFEALSYTWGDTRESREIELNGHTISVGANMELALRHLRSKTEVRVVWVDAVCINQRNIQERNQQVSLMRDIYSSCQGVLVWLGNTSRADHEQSNETPPCQWMTDFTHGPATSIAPHAEDESKVAKFCTDIKAYYRLPFALRHSLSIDHHMGAYCLISLLAQNKHVSSTDISFLSNHDAFHKLVLALDEVMTRPWWDRQWVIQEIVLARNATVHFGNFVASWTLFSRAARNYDHHRKDCCQSHYTHLHGNDIRHMERFSMTITELDDLRQKWQQILNDQAQGHFQISLRELLWQFRCRDTTDARDKIFALLPLVNEWGRQEAIYPNYSLGIEEVYRAVVEKVIDIDNSLLILMGSTEKTMSTLPSWVPDWTSKPPRYEPERLERTQLFHAARGTEAEVEFIGTRFLKLTGVYFDVVTSVSDLMEYRNDDATLHIFASWYKMICRDQPITADYPTGESRMEAYWRTLCMDTARYLGLKDGGADKRRRYRRCSRDYAQEGIKHWMDPSGLPHTRIQAEADFTLRVPSGRGNSNPNSRPSSPHSGRIDTQITEEERLNFVAVDFAITSATMERKLFITNKGYMGVGPASMAKGDKAYVFAGGHMPFIVRRSGVEEILGFGMRGCHRLIGECYIHGIMDGQMMAGFLRRKREVYLT